MNNEYNYVKKSVVVSVTDENDNPRLVEYSDNLEDILATENIVEELENEIEKSKDLKEKLKDKAYILLLLSFIVLFGIIYLTTLGETSFDFKILELLYRGFSYVVMPSGAFAVLYGIYRYHKSVMRFNQRNSYLNEQLKLAKFKLKTLRKNKQKEKEQEITQNQETQKVTSHIEYLNQLKNYLESLENGETPTIQPEIDYNEESQDKTKKLSI